MHESNSPIQMKKFRSLKITKDSPKRQEIFFSKVLTSDTFLTLKWNLKLENHLHGTQIKNSQIFYQLHIFISILKMLASWQNNTKGSWMFPVVVIAYKRRPRRPPFLRVESDGIGLTSSILQIFMLDKKSRDSESLALFSDVLNKN